MPVYEQRCECGFVINETRTFSEGPSRKCPKCGSEKLERIWGNVGLAFKGKGFYANDKKEKVVGKVKDFAMPSRGGHYN